VIKRTLKLCYPNSPWLCSFY